MLTDTWKDTNRAKAGWNLGIHDPSSSLAHDMNLEKFLPLDGALFFNKILFLKGYITPVNRGTNAAGRYMGT